MAHQSARLDSPQRYISFISAVLISSAAVLFFIFHQPIFGYGVLLVATIVGIFTHDKKYIHTMTLLIVALLIMSIVPINTDIGLEHMTVMGLAMAVIVGVPYVVSRYVHMESAITFPWHFSEVWTKQKWVYIGIVALVGYLVLPFYMITTNVYQNWPGAHTVDEVLRLFVGTNALGIWDELFFICTVFVLLSRHFSFWTANVLQAVMFSSFLYELGFKSWGLLMTFIFAMVQAYIFRQTHSLFYIVCVHLLFDLFLFLVLIHAHNRDVLNIFFY